MMVLSRPYLTATKGKGKGKDKGKGKGKSIFLTAIIYLPLIF